jgi:phosphoribosyl 1,2-cyclic phosphodiesterase
VESTSRPLLMAWLPTSAVLVPRHAAVLPPRRRSVGRLTGKRIKSRGDGSIVKFCVLASGSSGNSALIATGRTRVLIDAGLSLRELTRRLSVIGERPDQLTAVIITHEHSDHIGGLPTLARKHGIPAYVSKLTAPQIDWGESSPSLECFQAGARVSIGDIEIDSFTIPHDAVDPVGFCFRTEGIKIALVTDLGYIPDSIHFHVDGAQLLLMESNHDLEMLRVGPYPWSVKQRVMSRMGHLSNMSTCDFLRESFDGGTAHLVLGHLSEHNNHPEIVRATAAAVLEERGLATTLEVASQNQPGTVFQF